MPFWPLCSPVTEISVTNPDIDNWASPFSHMNTFKCQRRKEWRGEMQPGCMKRPSVYIRQELNEKGNSVDLSIRPK